MEGINEREAIRAALHLVDVQVGANIRARRKTSGVSQGTLAKALGLTFQQVQKYERGSNRVSASMLWGIARELRCAVVDLYAGVTDLPSVPAPEADAVRAFTGGPDALAIGSVWFRIPAPVRSGFVRLVKAMANVPDDALSLVGDHAHGRGATVVTGQGTLTRNSAPPPH